MRSVFALLCVVAMCATAQDSTQWVSDTMAMADSVQVEEIPSVTATASEATLEQPPTRQTASSGLGWLVMACCITALLAVGASVMAYLSHREVAELRKQLYDSTDNTNIAIQRLASELEKQANWMRSRFNENAPRAAQRVAERQQPRTRTHTTDTPARRQGPRTIFLAKPDNQDCFTRPSDHFELGNSLFELTTTDGVHGTFTVIDNADVHRFALMMPTDNLTRACSGEGIQLSTGKTGIVTDQPGEAVQEQGCWRITRKAVIHYV